MCSSHAGCTILSPCYLPFGLTLFSSLRANGFTGDFTILVASDKSEFLGGDLPRHGGLSYIFASDLALSIHGRAVYDKYFHDDEHRYRWSSKAGLMLELFETGGYDQVFFFDADVFFLQDAAIVFGELGDHALMLTPHWHPDHPQMGGVKFQDWFRRGLYNAGFIGATRKGIPILKWWHDACLSVCSDNPERGLFQDQKYLDLVPVIFDDVVVCRDKRFNVGGWRMDAFFQEVEAQRANGERAEPVFMHFSCLNQVALSGPSEPYIRDYAARLMEHGLEYNLLEKLREERREKENARQYGSDMRKTLGYCLRSRLRLGTRLRHLWEVFRKKPSDF